MQIKIKYHSDKMPRLEKIAKGDWIDLYTNQAIVTLNAYNPINYILKTKSIDPWIDGMKYNAGNILIARLGVSMQLPKGYDAEVKPRSSTFKNTGLLLTNSVGLIDNQYNGDEDEWLGIFYATRGGSIKRFDRLLQFRINEVMPAVEFEPVKKLGNSGRGGYGTTGK